MAPVEKRKIEEEQDEAKRAKVEGEVEEEIEEDDDLSDEEDFDEEDEEFDEDDDEPPFKIEDFEGVEMTEDDVQTFVDAYEEFIMDLHEEADKTKTEPMLLTKPQSIRPVPKTKEDFVKGMVVTHLAENMQEEKVRIATALQDSNDLEDDIDEELSDEKVGELLTKGSKASLALMQKELDTVDAMLKEDKIKEAFQQVLVFTDMIFDMDTHHAFSETTDVEAAKAVLTRLAATWKTVLANDDEKLGPKGIKAGVEDFVQSCVDDLVKGEFVDDQEVNQFKDVTFSFKA